MRRSYRYSRSRSRSLTRGSGYHRDRDYRDRDYRSDRRGHDRYDDYDDRRMDDDNSCRLHVADITEEVKEIDLEKAFGKYGEIKEVWMAKNPPCFAFVVFKNKDEADDALRDMDGRTVCGSRIRVTWARPRTRGKRKRFDPNMRCYQCGGRGHFSRDCDGGSSRRRGGRSRSGSRGGGYYNRRSRTRSFTRSRTVSRSPYRNGASNGDIIRDYA